MTLIKTYGFTTETDSEAFEFVFEIPDNCNFNVIYDNLKDIHTISVQLKSGQTQPSGTYISESCELNSINGLLNVYFQETLNSVTTKRPKITINENNC